MDKIFLDPSFTESSPNLVKRKANEYPCRLEEEEPSEGRDFLRVLISTSISFRYSDIFNAFY